MKKIFLLLTAVFVLFTGGCSLTGDDAPDGAAGLRLLVGDSKSKTVSDLKANDWSPQIVVIGTNRYLYFLSDRKYEGAGFVIGLGYQTNGCTNIAGHHAVFRAAEVRHGVYSNLHLYYSFGPDVSVASMVCSHKIIVDGLETLPRIHYTAKIGNDPFILRYLMYENDVVSSVSSPFSALSIPAGRIDYGGDEYMFLGTTITTNLLLNTFEMLPERLFRVILTSGPVMQTRTAYLSARQIPESTLLDGFLTDRTLRGAWPVDFIRPGGTHGSFGFIVSYGGMLYVLLYRQYVEFSSFVGAPVIGLADLLNPDFRRTIIVLPLLRVMHYAGTVDGTPSYDPGSGLYFSSNRDGKYNLYFVPKEYLYLPEWLEINEIAR